MFVNRFYNFLNVIRGPSEHSAIIALTKVYGGLNIVCQNTKHLHTVRNKALLMLRKLSCWAVAQRSYVKWVSKNLVQLTEK